MFDVNELNGIEHLSIYLARPSGELLGCLDDSIDDNSVSLEVGLNQQYKLSFNLNVWGESYQNWGEFLQEGMYLFVSKVGLFKMAHPSDSINKIKDEKSITAYSCEKELEDKTIQLSLNIGTETSQEYLVSYDADETESLVNAYTGIPYDWLVLYNTFPEQLGIVKDKYNSGYYGSLDSNNEITVTDSTLIEELNDLFTLVPRLKSKIYSSTDENKVTTYSLEEYVVFEYSEESGEIISVTLSSTFLNRVNYLITFYTKYRKQLSLLCLVLSTTEGNWSVGDIYGVSDGDYTLANKKYQFEADESLYSFLTTTFAQTTNCLVSFDIVARKINVTPITAIGDDTGIILSYDNLMNSMNISTGEDSLCTRLYVTGADDLSIEQVNFGLPYIDNIMYKLNVRDSHGNRIYVSDELAEKYIEYDSFKESLRDEYIQCSKDYNSYASQISEIKYREPNDSVKTDWGTYTEEELEAALTTYKNLLVTLESLYKEDYGTAGLNDDGSINESYIRETMYWYDYSAYQTTITQIECAISTYPYYDDEDNWTTVNVSYYKDLINAWETEWTLYGTIELQAKISTYKQNMDLLVDGGSVVMDSETGEAKTWESLTTEEKSEYGNLELNYYYDTFMQYYNNMVSAQAYLDTLTSQISELEACQSAAQERRTEIVQEVTLSNYFEENECKILNRLFSESTYSNENILTTSLNDTVDSLDVMCELLEDGKEKVSEVSRPQLQFSITADNFLGLVDYKLLWDDFVPGNYIYVQYNDRTYVKLRLVSYTFNPLLPSSSNLSMTFSNFIRSKYDLTDIAYILGNTSSVGSSSGSSGSSSGGTYGESDDIDVTISNTMLAKLLSSEQFGTRVTNVILDTIDVNAISARYATFNGLANGVTTIDGRCITTGYIVDVLYNGTDGSIDNTKGSVINLTTGEFSFAGGGLKYSDGMLYISGDGSGIDISSNSTVSNLSSRITQEIDSIKSTISALKSTALVDYCTNGDFSSATDLDGWKAGHSSVTQATYLNTSCAQIDATSGTSLRYIQQYINIPAANGGTFYIRFKAACAAGYEDSARVRVWFNNEYQYSSIGDMTDTWQEYEFEFNNVNNSTSATFRIYNYSNTVVYITDIEILGSAVTYIQSQVSQLADSWEVTLTENYATKASLALTLDADTGISKLSEYADCIELAGGELVINTGNLILDSDGNATFSGKLSAATGDFSGSVTSTSGLLSVCLSDARMNLKYNGTTTGYMDGNILYANTGIYGTRIGGLGVINLCTPSLTVADYTESGNTSSLLGVTGSVVLSTPTGTVTLSFDHGLMVTVI